MYIYIYEIKNNKNSSNNNNSNNNKIIRLYECIYNIIMHTYISVYIHTLFRSGFSQVAPMRTALDHLVQ